MHFFVKIEKQVPLFPSFRVNYIHKRYFSLFSLLNISDETERPINRLRSSKNHETANQNVKG